MTPEHEDDSEPALTDEVRALLNPRARAWLVLTVVLAVALVLAALLASRTVLSALWENPSPSGSEGEGESPVSSRSSRSAPHHKPAW
jgi:hypothetical protein